MRRFLVVATTTLAVLATQAAWGVSGTDPNDVTGGLDIRASSVTVVENADGTRRVRLGVKTYDEFDLIEAGSFYWQLDTWGGSGADYEVFMFGDADADGGPLFCLVHSTHGPLHRYSRHVTQGDSVATCAIPRRWLGIAKPISYRVAGRMEGVIDRAPDSGWYS
jgi:hypothetical protein